MNTNKFITLLLLFGAMLFSLSSYAYQFTFDGIAAGQYSIVMEVDRTSNGAINGRYAYKSTLNQQGRDKRSSWLYITPVGYSTQDYIIRDSNGNLQERWSNVYMSRSNGVNRLEAAVTNSKGKTFLITAVSSSKPSASWAGSYSIYSEGYRNCPVPISATLTLKATDNGYKGILAMTVADDYDNYCGSFFGDVVASVVDGKLKVTLKSSHSTSGSYGSIFSKHDEYYPLLPENSTILEITKLGNTYTLRPIGKMGKYLTDILELTIVKTK